MDVKPLLTVIENILLPIYCLYGLYCSPRAKRCKEQTDAQFSVSYAIKSSWILYFWRANTEIQNSVSNRCKPKSSFYTSDKPGKSGQRAHCRSEIGKAIANVTSVTSVHQLYTNKMKLGGKEGKVLWVPRNVIVN